MVNRKAAANARLTLVFHALADATRRAMLERLAQGGCTVGELAEPFAMSLPAITKHVKVLADSGLISKQRQGKFIHCQLEAKQLAEAKSWIAEQEAYWTAQLDGFERYLEQRTGADSSGKSSIPKKRGKKRE